MDASELERLDARLRDEVNVPAGDDARIRASLETAALYVERAIGGYSVPGAVRDDWTAGIIPPIKASRNTAALDLVRQNELLITQRADALARQAATGEQPWSRTVMETARKHGDHNLLRDVAIYRDMWHIDDPDQPIGQRPPGRSGRQEQHWCNLDARITGQGSGVVNPGKTRKANRNRPENPTPRVETPNPAAMEERNPQWKTRQEPSSNNSPDGPTQ